MSDTELLELTRCQRWILESLSAVVKDPAKAVTATELAAKLHQNSYWTGVYLVELLELELVRTAERAHGDVWWPTPGGLAVLSLPPAAMAS